MQIITIPKWSSDIKFWSAKKIKKDGGRSRSIQGEQKGDQTSPTEYKVQDN